MEDSQRTLEQLVGPGSVMFMFTVKPQLCEGVLDRLKRVACLMSHCLALYTILTTGHAGNTY